MFTSLSYGHSTLAVTHVLFAAVLLGRANLAAGGMIQDQYFPGSDGYFTLISSTNQEAQTFPVTVSGMLDEVNVYVNDSNATGENLLWDIRPVTAGAPLGSDTSVLASGTVLAASIPVFPHASPDRVGSQPLRYSSSTGRSAGRHAPYQRERGIWLARRIPHQSRRKVPTVRKQPNLGGPNL